MSYTIFEKILLKNSKVKEIRVGDILEVDVNRVMIHDFFIPFCVNKFKEMGFGKVFDPDKVVIINDHLVPTSFINDYKHHQVAEEFCKEHNISRYHRADGVCHQLMHEQGYVKPGDIVLGTDSHTVTYGALGLLATGIGYTEMAAILGTGKTWLKVAPTIRVNINGLLQKGVSSKDIILKLLGDFKADGATYKILEFGGSAITSLSVDSRLTISNMAVEIGAKAGIIEPDNKTLNYLSKHFSLDFDEMLISDQDACYESVIEYDAVAIEPVVSCPYSVDNVKAIAQLEPTKIDQAFLGSCTNGRLEDLKVAANILKDKKIHPQVRFIVVPASREIFLQATRRGYIKTLVEAGAIVNTPSCGLCAGRSCGVLENGEKIISSNNRNFLGRMGGNKVDIYLGSPATVAASALEGYITDPRKYM